MATIIAGFLAIITFPFWGLPVLYQLFKMFIGMMKFLFWIFIILVFLKAMS